MNVCGVAEYTRSREESKSLDRHNNVPSVIISASGMATGGRVLHHLKHYIGDARNTVLLAGYQAGGTRGDRLARGEKEIKIHGRMWPVKAQVAKLDNMSGHADYEELLKWMGTLASPPTQIFVTHGEPVAAASMQKTIIEKLGWNAVVPEQDQVFLLS